jgi:hypothetical protein
MFDGKAFGEEIAGVVKAYVDRTMSPLAAENASLRERLTALESRSLDDPGHDADRAVIERMIADALASLEPSANGKAAELDMDVVGSMIDAAVTLKVAHIPAPEAGKSVTVEDVSPMIAELVAKAVEAAPPAKDGVGLAGALIDRTGELVVTLTNGDAKHLGPVVGKDVDQSAVERSIADAVAAIPKPSDGRDGFGFDDLEFEHDGERGFTLKFVRGDQVKSFGFRVPVTIYRDVWREGAYEKGDAVTWGGSLWIAQKDTDAKPDSGDGWRLAVKRGRDAKDPAKL